MDAATLAGSLRGDPTFRRAALLDADAVVDAHGIDWVVLLAASHLIGVDPWRGSLTGRHEHAALFALFTAVSRRCE